LLAFIAGEAVRKKRGMFGYTMDIVVAVVEVLLVMLVVPLLVLGRRGMSPHTKTVVWAVVVVLLMLLMVPLLPPFF
jgi:hypothetical protein